MLGRIGKHYSVGALGQLSALLGSFDALGNPVGLISNVGTGVKDFFYEPLEGISSESGVIAGVAQGVAKGTGSLVSKTMDGTFNAASKISGSVGGGLAGLSMDDRYQRIRAQKKAREATSVADGLVMGGREFGRGLYEGVTGIVAEPYRNMKKASEKEGAGTGDAVVGFGKGVVKGVIGMAVKPAVGVLDLTSRTTEAMRNMSRLDQTLVSRSRDMRDPWSRVRPPRLVSTDGKIYPYSLPDAYAQQWLSQVNLHGSPEEHLVYVGGGLIR